MSNKTQLCRLNESMGELASGCAILVYCYVATLLCYLLLSCYVTMLLYCHVTILLYYYGAILLKKRNLLHKMSDACR